MLTPEQSRAARGWLDWSQDDLAKRANVSLSTVRDFEKKRRTPIGNNLMALAAALKHAGVSPTFDEFGKPQGISSRIVSDDQMNGAAIG
jgi:transcriptional regulator with XRE-family HTH domain